MRSGSGVHASFSLLQTEQLLYMQRYRAFHKVGEGPFNTRFASPCLVGLLIEPPPRFFYSP